MLRHLVSLVLRGTERSQSFLIGLGIATSALGILKDQYSAHLGAEYAQWIAAAAFITSILSFILLVLKGIKIWRFLPPRYYGMDVLVKRFGSALDFGDTIFIGTDGRARIDTPAALKKLRSTLDCTVFPGTDAAQMAETGRINAEAFRGSVYAQSAENKAGRNARISRRNPLTFALLQQSGMYRGLASTIPMTPTTAQQYLSGMISDNDFTEAVVAAPGESADAVVIFLIAVNPQIPRVRHYAVLTELVRICLLQVILITLSTPAQKSFRLVAANSEPGVKNLFKMLGFTPQPIFKSADQQEVFILDVRPRGREEAIAYLKQTAPHIAALVQPHPGDG